MCAAMTEAAPSPRPQPAGYRWLVLLACSVAMFGNYYVFDALYPVTPLLEKAFGFTGEQVGLLDTAYNVAALLTLLAGGVLIDRLGTARSSVLFGAIGAAGTLLIAFGPVLTPGTPALGMAAGRFVLGVGSELFIVAATTVVGRWFKGKEISFALAIQLLIARFGSLAADQSPNFAGGLFERGWQAPLLLAGVLGVAWFVFAVIYAGLEANAARRYGVKGTVATDKLVLGDLVRFDRAYWWVVGLCVAFYATIFPFRTFANLFFIDYRGLTNEAAGSLKSVLPLLSMIGMPLFGLLADKFGKRALMMAAGSALLVPPFLLMLWWHTGVVLPEVRLPLLGTVLAAGTPLELVLAMAMMGLAFALVPAVLWPAVTYLVPGSRLGSAYALMTFCQQVGWAGMSWGMGKVKDAGHASAAAPGGWVPVVLMLAVLSSAGFVFSFLLWRSERGAGAHGLEDVTPREHA
ncbi:major facilitator superfamily MFS_1 [Anaeromyxobacter dehalogenans 2CP-1]|uniref:Lysosomal dipeptide transporter MFSD1 n=2 Tax=Anaeromyxobacter dehalogenans TaxID=161493 RepID=B8J8L3_ANAD2|nr:major facilitator superfamily MFS_1 [Anaeromyxobacter dehalogenans 2CP-1]